MIATAKMRPMSILYWMALGTFAIGTEGFMIAPLLPSLAEDLSVGLVAAGQLVTVFTISYAFSSPILTALTGGISRRNFSSSRWRLLRRRTSSPRLPRPIGC
jgi:predicted MFS family arabinose efflux permease